MHGFTEIKTTVHLNDHVSLGHDTQLLYTEDYAIQVSCSKQIF